MSSIGSSLTSSALGSSITSDLTSGSSTSTAGSNTGTSGGIDVQGTVASLIYVARAPERLMQAQQSQLDSQASALTDLQLKLGTLAKSINALRDFNGALNSQYARSSNTSVLSATADKTATSGTHSIVVGNLATTSSYYSKSVNDPKFTFGAGSSMSLQVGGGTAANLVLDGKTLSQAAQYITAQLPGVNATVINDANGSRLSIVSGTSGLPGALHITSDSSQMAWQSSSDAKNAQLTVDGVPVESTTNTVSGAIPGLTLTLSGQSATATQITVGADTSQASAAVNTFVSAYNSVITAINSQFAYDSVNQTAGALSGDSTIQGLQSNLLSDMSYTVAGNGSVQSLRDLGVNMNNDGTLTVDDSALSNTLSAHYSDFQNFFQATSSDPAAPSGFAIHFGTDLTAINDITQGPIALDIKGVSDSSKDIQDQISDFEIRIAAKQQTLTDEYNRINVMLETFSNTQAQLTSQFDSLSSMYTK
jgi:flagellar hook-associated protein 2